MYKTIEKYKKPLMAVFGVVLMIIFILPSSLKRGGHGRHGDAAFTVGKDEVSITEARLASQEWDELKRDLGQQLVILFPTAPQLPGEIEKHKDLFLLLQKEAERNNLRVPDDRVMGLLRAIASARRVGDPNVLQRALRGALLISALVEHVGDSVKVSRPLVVREMADNGQRVKLDLVHWSVEDFRRSVAAPTPEEIEKQFNELKSVAPGNPTDSNPFGFGYLVPSQVKLLYFTVPHEEVVRAVRKSVSDFDWDMKAWGYYKKHAADFPATQPDATSKSATTNASTQTAATSKPAPTTKPFAEVKEQIVNDLMRPDVDNKTEAISALLDSRMTADFEAQQKRAANAPADFGTRQYFDRIAAEVEKLHGVKLGVSEINEPKDVKGLAELKGIGQSFVSGGEMSFPQYVMRWTEPFVSSALARDQQVLSLDEPSKPLRDLPGNVYVFAVRDATPAHAPAGVDAVKDKLVNDLKTRAAFEEAVSAARKFRKAIVTSGLGTAAKSASKDVFATPAFNRRGMTTPGFLPVTLIPNVELGEDARQKLIGDAFTMLAEATPDNPHPNMLTELPTAGRVVVSELAEVERAWRDEDQQMFEAQLTQRIAGDRAQRILGSYFSFDSVKRRMDYRSFGEAS
jgi:hypothetical protein